jgi:hypothetical protein
MFVRYIYKRHATRLHCIERGIPDPILETEGLKVLGKRRNPVLLEVCMLVMLLNMEIHVLVKVEVLAVSLIPEELQFGAYGVPGRDNSLSAKEESVQGLVHLSPVLGLAKFLHVMPPA